DAAQPRQLGHWLGIRLSQTAPNVDAIGAWIEVQVGATTLRRELTVGGGHAGGQLGWTHFGLGPAGAARVHVEWPDGEDGPRPQVLMSDEIHQGSEKAVPLEKEMEQADSDNGRPGLRYDH